MGAEKKLKQQRKRRSFRVRNGLLSRGAKPRVSVFRSLKQIYAQVIDDATGKTLVSFSSLKLKDAKGDKSSFAKQVGLELGKLATEKAIKEVFFDRGAYRYHGRVRALAEGLREGGLTF
ncbi:50S ribosomal protein L18 [Candidatus Dependentiae bacterium]|nr:50S ribosomal protein L18 [Candidatus Dependentiae bacterium]